jgi:hypothetical protein
MNREAFFVRKVVTKDIEVPEFGTVKIRKLTQSEVENVRKNYLNNSKELEGTRYVVAKATLDTDGNPFFSDGDQAKLVEVDFDKINTIATAVMEFSGLTVPKNS